MLAVKEFQTSGNDIDFEEVEMLLEAEDDSDPEEPVQLVSTHLDGETGVTNKIKGAIYNVAKEFVYIGFLLHEVDIYEYYLEKGYSSVYEYAASELGWKKSSVNNFINVCRTFGRREPNSQVLHMGMKDGYEKFNYSQLCEMLSMNEKQREQITPDMTVKQIREVKREDHFVDLNLQQEMLKMWFHDRIPERYRSNYNSEEDLRKGLLNTGVERFYDGHDVDIMCKARAIDIKVDGRKGQLGWPIAYRLFKSLDDDAAEDLDDPEETPVQTSGKEEYIPIVLNNLWVDLPQDLVKSLIMFCAGNIDKPRAKCFDITIKAHVEY